MKYKEEGTSIQTYTGKIFYPSWPTPDSICIEDIAHSLGFICRFGGHCRVFYSVGQHCVIMSRWFRKRGRNDLAKWALLHELGEGLGMVDLPRPVKYLDVMKPYRTLEKSVQYAGFRAFGLYGEAPKEVKELDTRICVAEAKVLLPNLHPENIEYINSLDTKDLVIRPYKNIMLSEENFLKEYKILQEI